MDTGIEGTESRFRREVCWIHLRRETWKQFSGLRASKGQRKTKFYPETGQFHNSSSWPPGREPFVAPSKLPTPHRKNIWPPHQIGLAPATVNRLFSTTSWHTQTQITHHCLTRAAWAQRHISPHTAPRSKIWMSTSSSVPCWVFATLPFMDKESRTLRWKLPTMDHQVERLDPHPKQGELITAQPPPRASQPQEWAPWDSSPANTALLSPSVTDPQTTGVLEVAWALVSSCRALAPVYDSEPQSCPGRSRWEKGPHLAFSNP